MPDKKFDDVPITCGVAVIIVVLKVFSPKTTQGIL
jgi:hypothetical protein